MPFSPPVVFADGNVMQWSEVEQNLAALRTWVNAIPSADVSNGAISQELLVRPSILGFPTQALVGDSQSVLWEVFGNDAAPQPLRESWGARSDRLTIRPGAIQRDRMLTKFGRSYYLHDRWDHDVQIHITGSMHPVVKWNEASAPPYYPNGAGGPVDAVDGIGYLQVYMIDRSTGTETAYTTGRAKVMPMQFSSASQKTNFLHDHFHCVYYARLTGGRTLDFVLGYEPQNDSNVYQLDLSELQFRAEVS